MNFIFGLLFGFVLGVSTAWFVLDKKNQSSLNKKISLAEKRREEADTERIAMQNQLTQSLKQQDFLNERFQILESAKALAESQLEKNRNSLDEKKEQFEELRIKNVQLESTVVNLESQVLESRNKSNERKSHVEQLQSENSKLIARAAEAESQLSEVRQYIEEKKSQLIQLQAANTQLESRSVEAETRLEASRRNIEEQKKLILVAEEKLSKTFKALAVRVLKENEKEISEEISGTIIEPLKVKISELSQYVERVEKSRTESHGELKNQIHSLMRSQKDMELQTEKLSKALREPSGRGRWGEIQLRRVAELAGMHSYCDFFEQESAETGDGKIRPDMRVQLPSGKNIIVDSKVPLDAYLNSLDAHSEDELKVSIKKHASQVRRHIIDLSKKSYWEQFQPSPEFVVLFLPGESFFSAALQGDPTLIEVGVENKIIIATPTTLIALLKAVYYGWKQDSMAENAQKISELAQELHKRMATMLGHFSKLQSSLSKSVEAYNSVAGSYQSMVLPQIRRFESLEVSSTKTIEDDVMTEIDVSPRHINLSS